VLVRHGPVAPDPSAPPASWPLDPAGRAAVRQLAGELREQDVARVITSPETKAFETGAILARSLGVSLIQDERLREVEMRTGFLPQDEFRRRITGYLAGARDPDFEPPGMALGRVLSLVEDLSDNAGTVALVSHGRLLALLVGSLVPSQSPAAVWPAMRFPDWAVIDRHWRRSLRDFGNQTDR
jgi:2,3-bisphosphoglycerate-dependent phosphoglycerate mutase